MDAAIGLSIIGLACLVCTGIVCYVLGYDAGCKK